MRRNTLVILFLLFAGAGVLAAKYNLVPLPFNIGEDKPVTAENSKAPKAEQQAAYPTPKGAGDGAPKESTSGSSTLTQATDTTIDISRISPDGGSVFAGRAAPNAHVTIYEDGKPVASGKADGEGEWSVVTDHKFASVDPSLAIKAGAEPGPQIAAADTGDQDRTAERSASPTTVEPNDKPASAPGSAKAATADLMSKFEALVEEARRDAAASEKAANDKTADNGAASTDPNGATANSDSGDSDVENEGEKVAAATAPPAMAQAVPTAPPTSRADTADAQSPPVAVQAKPTRAASSSQLTVPVPIMFVYNEPTLTDEGHRATSLLLEYVKLKHLDTVSLSGHADERGSGEYNLDLSRERLETVARLLRDGGFSGKLDLAAKGESEPFTGIDRSKYTGEALFQLDRRVELHLSQ